MFAYPTRIEILQASNAEQIVLGLNPVRKQLL